MSKGASDMSSAGGERFPVTHWSLVLAAALNPENTQARDAFARLCELYWPPLYRFVRRSGHTRPDAEDLTQSFFERLIAKRSLGAVNPSRGTFRSFLISALKHFMCNEYHKANAEKRAPQNGTLSFDAGTAEAGLANQVVDGTTPETIYDRECAWALVKQTFQQLRARYEAEGKGELFGGLKPALMGDDRAPYRELAQRFGTSEEALRAAATRMRKAFRKLLKQQLGRLVGHPAQVAEELRHLLAALGG